MYFPLKYLKKFLVFFDKLTLRRKLVLLLLLASFSFVDGFSQCTDISPTGDCDGDGLTNALDLDDDNDGISDIDETNSCIASGGNAIYGTNLVTNGSFESGNVNFSSIYSYTSCDGIPWNGWEFNPGQYSVVQNASHCSGNPEWLQGPQEGNNLMIIDFPSVGTVNLWYQTFTVDPNTVYEFSAFLANIYNSSYDLSDPSIQLAYAENGGTVNVIGSGVTVSESDGWVETAHTFTTSSSATTLTIYIQNANAGGVGNDAGLDNITLRRTYCDSDGDGLPNHLDTDSDNDGCPDALEANSSLNYSDLNANGSINTALYPIGSISDTNPGVPNNTPTSGIGTSQNSSQQAAECDPCNNTSSLFIDSDLDGVGNSCDLDDDNDGILDTEEDCTVPLAVSFSSLANLNGTTTGGISVTTSTTLTPSAVNETGYFYEPSTNWTLISGVSSLPATQFSHGGYTGFPHNLDFTFNSANPEIFVKEVYIHLNSVDQIRYVMNASSNPNLAYELISGNNLVEDIGVGGSLSWGDIDPNTRDTSFAEAQLDGDGGGSADGTIRFYRTDGMPITNLNLIVQEDPNQIALEGYFLGMEIITTRDTDRDGTPNCLDTDSDGDGCNDVLESDGNDPNDDGRLGGVPTLVDGFGRVIGTGISGGYNGLKGSENIAVSLDIDTNPSNVSTTSSATLVNFTVVASADQATAYSGGTPVYGTPNN